MRGSVKKRYKGSWTIILDVGGEADPVTGETKRKQKWITVKGTKREAEAKLAELLNEVRKGEFVEPSKVTLGQWLTEWLEKAIAPPAKRPRTYETYLSVVTNHILPSPLGTIPLQRLRSTDLKRYYLDSPLAEPTLSQHHALLSSALKAAVLEGLVQRNVAPLVIGKPRRGENHEAIKSHCWEAHEARAFLNAAKETGIQAAAFYALALDTGARKGELCGLKWDDVNFAKGTLTILRQLIKPGPDPLFGPPKNGNPRTIHLGQQTVALLAKQKTYQAEVKLANRTAYNDLGLVFAKDWGELQKRTDHLGDPLQMNNLGQREYKRLIEKAQVRPIKFHGLRHTCATLMLQAGVPAPVVQQRLGHKRIEMTLGIYAHAMPSMQQDAAEKLAELLSG